MRRPELKFNMFPYCKITQKLSLCESLREEIEYAVFPKFYSFIEIFSPHLLTSLGKVFLFLL